MEKESCGFDSAKIERGIVAEVSSGKYRVKSYGRDPLVTPPMKPLTSGATFAVNDQVFFFMFDDGDGRILGKF